jgi:MFS family permease
MDLTPLRRYPQYRWLYSAQFVSLVGSMVTHVTLPFQMYALTQSTFSVGLLGLAELVPLLLTAFVGGALADTIDRRRLVLATDLGLAAGTAVLAVNAMRDAPHVWVLYVAAGWMSGLNGLQRPSLEALTQQLVGREDLPAASALAAFRGSSGMIVGPAIGGALIAAAGVPATYLFDFVTYAFAFVAVLRIALAPRASASARLDLSSVADGFRYARSRQELIGTYVVDFVAMVFGMPMALFPALAERLGGPGVLGLLYSAPAVGALVASVTARWTRRIHLHGLGILLAAAAWGLAIVAFGLCRTVAPALVFLVVAGGADCLSGILRMTMWNQTIPAALRGRLAGIEMVSYMSGPLLGHVEAGAVASLFGVEASVVSGGVLCVVGVILCGILLPRFVSYDARHHA